MRKERWVFCESELANPAACRGYDEFTTGPLGFDDVDRTELGVVVYRDGSVSNRWDDGTVGIPAEIADLADVEETLYSPDRDEYADVWADVFVNHLGQWLGWAGAVPQVRSASVRPS